MKQYIAIIVISIIGSLIFLKLNDYISKRAEDHRSQVRHQRRVK